MLNEQVAGLLQNNAGNPAMVKRIAEENQLSQTEIAQALKIPEESAARYMPAQGEPTKPGMEAPKPGMAPAEIAGAANAALPPAVGSAGGGMAPPGAGAPVGGAPASPMAQMADSMQKPVAPAAPVPTVKPAALPADMKPQGLEKPIAKPGQMQEKPMARPGGVPSLPRVPSRFGGTEGEQAFVNAFNRLRGNVQ